MADSKAEKVYQLLAKDHPSEDDFKELLTHVAPGVLAKRYLSGGLPFVFEGQPHKFLAFREAVGRIFDVPPQQIAVMGSARFGFSTSPRKQTPEGAKPLDQNSDMDLIIVSPEIFHRALESFANFTFKSLVDENELKSDAKSASEKVQLPKRAILQIRRRAKALHFGWVSPTDFEDGTSEKQSFYDMQREAATQLFGTAPPGPINRIGARIYKSWDAAERSYEFSFTRLAERLGIVSFGDLEPEDPLDDAEPTEQTNMKTGQQHDATKKRS